MQMLRELRATNLDKLKQKAFMFQTPYKQKTMLDVQSIIADYRCGFPQKTKAYTDESFKLQAKTSRNCTETR